MKILLIAYALSPRSGSESAIGWGWASGLAVAHDVTVVSRTSNREDVETYLEAHPDLKLKLKWVPNAKYKGPFAPNINYLIWMKGAVALQRGLVAQEKFDIVHHVSYGSLNVPTKLWALGLPFVLGPVGGGQTLNPIYRKELGPMPLSERLRNWRIALLPYRPAIRSMVKNAALVLATNLETEQIATRCGGRTVLFGDSGIRPNFLRSAPPTKRKKPGLRLLWTGRMLYRKGVPLVFHAMKMAGREDFTLELLGSGPMESSWRQIAEELGVADRVFFRGQVPFAQVFDYYDNADLFVFPSVNDSFGSQLLEAASRGLPILTLGHQGAGALLPESVAWKVPVDSAENTIGGMAKAMIALADAPDRLSAMASAAIEYANTESWPNRVERMSQLYHQLLH